LESGDLSRPQALEMVFIERQGLAAWIAVDWNRFLDVNENEGGKVTPLHPPHDLVMALADLALGDREEIAHG